MTEKKASKEEDLMTEKEILEKLEELKRIPEKVEKDIEKLEKDKKKARLGLIAPCVIFGILVIWQTIMVIVNLVNQNFEDAIINMLLVITDTIFIAYEVMLYQSRVGLMEMYAINRRMLINWTDGILSGLEREAELTLQLREMRDAKK